MTFDLLIRNGRVIDGLGNPWFRADVGISQGRIAAVGRLASSQAETVIDAQGKVVCPGFIDVHNHSDLILLREPDHTPKVAQGITTEILGSDGLGYAPMSPKHLRETRNSTAPSTAVCRRTWSFGRPFPNTWTASTGR